MWAYTTELKKKYGQWGGNIPFSLHILIVLLPDFTVAIFFFFLIIGSKLNLDETIRTELKYLNSNVEDIFL